MFQLDKEQLVVMKPESNNSGLKIPDFESAAPSALAINPVIVRDIAPAGAVRQLREGPGIASELGAEPASDLHEFQISQATVQNAQALRVVMSGLRKSLHDFVQNGVNEPAVIGFNAKVIEPLALFPLKDRLFQTTNKLQEIMEGMQDMEPFTFQVQSFAHGVQTLVDHFRVELTRAGFGMTVSNTERGLAVNMVIGFRAQISEMLQAYDGFLMQTFS